MTRESPAIHSRSFFCGVNFGLAGGLVCGGLRGWFLGCCVLWRGDHDRDVDRVCVVAAGHALDEVAWLVELEDAADAGEAAGEGERHVAGGSGLLVERRLVHAGCVQERAEEECEDGDDEAVACGREAASVLGEIPVPGLPRIRCRDLGAPGPGCLPSSGRLHFGCLGGSGLGSVPSLALLASLFLGGGFLRLRSARGCLVGGCLAGALPSVVVVFGRWGEDVLGRFPDRRQPGEVGGVVGWCHLRIGSR